MPDSICCGTNVNCMPILALHLPRDLPPCKMQLLW